MIRIWILNIIIILSILISCKVESISATSETQEYPNMTQNNYSHYIYKNEKKYLYANIEYAEFFEKKNLIKAKKFYAEIYNSKGEMITKINSDSAEIDKNTKKIYIKDNAVFEILEHKTKLFSQEFDLDYENNLLICEYEVLFTKEDGSFLKADSLKSEIKKESTKFVNFEIKYYYDEDEKKGAANEK
jgi:Lipopolysaccharide-assembly, LptC-related